MPVNGRRPFPDLLTEFLVHAVPREGRMQEVARARRTVFERSAAIIGQPQSESMPGSIASPSSVAIGYLCPENFAGRLRIEGGIARHAGLGSTPVRTAGQRGAVSWLIRKARSFRKLFSNRHPGMDKREPSNQTRVE